MKGYAAVWRGEYAAALTDLDHALSKPLTRYWRGYALENRAYCYQQLQRNADAIRDYSLALRLLPGDGRTRAERGILYEQAGQKDLALDDFTEALRIDSSLANAWFHRGSIYLQQRAYQQARDDFREAIRCVPDDTRAYYEAGLASSYLGDLDSALSSFEVAIHLNPKHGHAYAGRGRIYRMKKEYEKALADLDEAIRLIPHDTDPLLSRALVYDDLGRYDEEIADLTEVIRLDPRNEKTLDWRGRSYRMKKDFAHATEDFTELIRITQAGGAYNERARTYFRSGQYALALADYQQAAAFPGGTVDSYVKPLAWLLATCPDPKFRDGDDAVARATKDCERTQWHSSNEVDTLAAACAEAGKFEEAIRYEEQAIALPGEEAAWEREMQERLALYQKAQPYREELKK